MKVKDILAKTELPNLAIISVTKGGFDKFIRLTPITDRNFVWVHDLDSVRGRHYAGFIQLSTIRDEDDVLEYLQTHLHRIGTTSHQERSAA